MAVPNTETFSMQDVKTELATSSNDLVTFFSIADDAKFDPAYKGSKNSLLNFRNYSSSGKTVTYLWISVSSYYSLPSACLFEDPFTQRVAWMHDIGTTIPIAGDIIYTDLDATTTFDGDDGTYSVDQGGVKIGVLISSTGVVIAVGNC